jgi:hypothetical protein
LDAAVDGFAVTYTDEEALKLVDESTLTTDCIIDMVLVDMS